MRMSWTMAVCVFFIMTHMRSIVTNVPYTEDIQELINQVANTFSAMEQQATKGHSDVKVTGTIEGQLFALHDEQDDMHLTSRRGQFDGCIRGELRCH